MIKRSPQEARQRVDRIIRNTYKTLMTRGMKGCYVYFYDDETRKFFEKKVSFASSQAAAAK